MGQYYRIVNLDKYQSFNAHYFDSGIKLMESPYVGNKFVDAVTELLCNEWAGDRVAYVGDYAHGDTSCPNYEKYEDFSHELNGIDIYSASSWNNNFLPAYLGYGGYSYSSDCKIEGRDPEYYRYVINLDKKVFYDREKMPVSWTWKDETGVEHETKLDPLLLFLALGNGLGGGDYDPEYKNYELVGSWAGDLITATNEEPYLNPNFGVLGGYSFEGIGFSLQEIECPFDPEA